MYKLNLICAAMMVAVLAGIQAPASGAEVTKETDATSAFDIKPFALPNTPQNEVWFEETRDITRIVVAFDEDIPQQVAVSYQRKTWPETRVEEAAQGHPGGFGWIHQDDWFNGQWQKALVDVTQLDEHRAVITFKGVKDEYPTERLDDYNVTFRRTYAVKVEAEGNPVIQQICTASTPMQTKLSVELAAGSDTPHKLLSLEGYNATIVSDGDKQKTSFDITVSHMKPAHAYCGDDGHVKFIFGDDAFSISLTSLEQDGPIWFADKGIYIRRASDPTTFEEYQERCRNLRTINQQVLQRGEQSLAGAHHGQPRPHVDNFNLGCAGAAQRFWLEANGDVTLHGRNVRWLPSMHPERWKNAGGEAGRFYFGLETWRIVARYPDPEPVMAYNILAHKKDCPSNSSPVRYRS